MLSDDEAALPGPLRSDHRRFLTTEIYDAPEWYDVDYAGYRGEAAFYARLVKRHCPLAARDITVELGAGTGRLTLPLVQSGTRVHAVEPAVGMRAYLAQKARRLGVDVEVEDANAATFAGPAQAPSFVFFPFNGLLHLPSMAALEDALAHIHRRLAAGGVFAFDVTSPYWESMSRGRVGWGRVDERVHPTSGRRFLTGDRCRYDAATRTMHIDIRYAYVDGDAPGQQTSLTQRMWTFPELLAALERCGFIIDEVAGDVDGARFDDGSPRLLVSAARSR